MHTRFRTVVITTLVLLAVSACGSEDPTDMEEVTPPTMEEVAGDYSATELMGGGYDVIDLGGSMELTLTADGELSGTLYIPPEADGPLTFDMAGTYTLSGLDLTFDQDADTFVRDATWTWEGAGVIGGEWTGSGGSATVRLER